MGDVDTHNDSFRAVIEKLQSRITELEGSGDGENHLIYPQQWATGDGTESNPWANNCIESAYAACPAGGTIFLRAGYYQLAGQLTIIKSINIIGEGINKTIIKTANARGFRITADYVSIERLTLDGDAETDGTQYLTPLSFANCNYGLARDIEVKNAGYYGINIFEVNHSSFQNLYAHDNYRHGMHPGSNTAGRNKYNIYRDIYAWNNGVSGFSDRGNNQNIEKTYNVYDNIQCWDNASEWYTRNAFIVACQKAVVISNCIISGSEGRGLYLQDLEDSSIVNCTINLNATYGMYIVNAKNLNFTNVIVKNNNVLDGSNSGIIIKSSSDIRFTSCQSYDDREIKLQRYGLITTGTVGLISLIGCKLTPNKTGEISNDGGAVITQLPNGGNVDLVQLTADFEALLLRIKAASEVVNK